MTPSDNRTQVEVEGRRLHLSNLDKVLYPGTGFTKAGVIDYYRRIAPVLLPHLAGRALTSVRFPDGTGRPGFFEKHCPDHRPDWVKTIPFLGRSKDEVVTHCLAEDLPTLVWLANLAALELHAPMAKADDPDHPTAIVFDLDPGAPAGQREACTIAVVLREVLGALQLAAFPKTSGKKGVHLYVPLNPSGPSGPTEREIQGRGPGSDQTECREFAHSVAERVAESHPGKVTTVMAKAARGGRVFVDWSQNARHKTTVAPYSLRATPSPSVSTPLSWDEVEAAAGDGDGGSGAVRFGPEEVLARVERSGDLFAPVLDIRQELPA